jgi:hypothetical protein
VTLWGAVGSTRLQRGQLAAGQLPLSLNPYYARQSGPLWSAWGVVPLPLSLSLSLNCWCGLVLVYDAAAVYRGLGCRATQCTRRWEEHSVLPCAQQCHHLLAAVGGVEQPQGRQGVAYPPAAATAAAAMLAVPHRGRAVAEMAGCVPACDVNAAKVMDVPLPVASCPPAGWLWRDLQLHTTWAETDESL